MQHIKEASNILPALKSWRHVSIGLSRYKCHN